MTLDFCKGETLQQITATASFAISKNILVAVSISLIVKIAFSSITIAKLGSSVDLKLPLKT